MDLDTDLQQKGCCTDPERPSWECGSLSCSCQNARGRAEMPDLGRDARPGHLGMRGDAPSTVSVNRSGECLTF